MKALLESSKDKTELTFGGDAKSDYDGENKDGTLIWLAHLHELPEQRLEDLGLFKGRVAATNSSQDILLTYY